MIGVIGVSYTAEYAVKGLYESTVGAVTAWLATEGAWAARTAEDRFIQEVARDYSSFIHATPWYEYPFRTKLSDLWRLKEAGEGPVLRRWERRVEFTMELLFKSAWGWAIKQGTQASYDPEALEIQAWVQQGSQDMKGINPGVRVLQDLGGRSTLLSLPRYEPFGQAVRDILAHNVRLVEVAGNEYILMTIIAPKDWRDLRHRGMWICEWTILTQPEHKRVALLVPLGQLHETLPSLEKEGVQFDHLYDF